MYFDTFWSRLCIHESCLDTHESCLDTHESCLDTHDSCLDTHESCRHVLRHVTRAGGGNLRRCCGGTRGFRVNAFSGRSVFQCVAVSQYFVVCCGGVSCCAVRCSVVQLLLGAVAGVPEVFMSTPFQVAVCCSVLRRVTVLCSVLQCGAVAGVPEAFMSTLVQVLHSERYKIYTQIHICTYIHSRGT